MNINSGKNTATMSDVELKERFCAYTGEFGLNHSFKESLWDDIQSGNGKAIKSKRAFATMNIAERMATVILICMAVGGVITSLYFINAKISSDNRKVVLVTSEYDESELEYINHMQNIKNDDENADENLYYIQNYGIDKTSTEILSDFEYKLSLKNDTKLWECSESRIIIFNIRGAIIYDRNKEQTVATIDLQDINCNNIRGEESAERYPDSKAFVENEKLYIFNEASGKAYGKCYVYYLDDLEDNYVKALKCDEIIDATDALLDKWNSLVGEKQRETYYETWEEAEETNINIADETLFYAILNETTNYTSWDYSQHILEDYMMMSLNWVDLENTEYLSTILVDGEDKKSSYNTYIKLCTKKCGTNDYVWEHIPLGFEEAVDKYIHDETMPEYSYSGNDIMGAIVNYIMEYETWEPIYDTPLVIIPTVDIVDTKDKENQKIVFIIMSRYLYEKVGKEIRPMGHAQCICVPCKVELTYGDTWRVEAFDTIGWWDSDDPDIRDEIFEEYPEVYSKLKKAEKKGRKDNNLELQLEGLRQYIYINNLDITYLQYTDSEYEYKDKVFYVNSERADIFDVEQEDIIEKSIGAIGKEKDATKRELTIEEYYEIREESEYYKNIVAMGYDAVEILENMIETCDKVLENETDINSNTSFIAKFKRTIAANAIDDIMEQ